MKDWCMRCNKSKKGVHETVILKTTFFICNSCATKIQNLLDLYKVSKNVKYKTQLEHLMFNAVGFSKT